MTQLALHWSWVSVFAALLLLVAVTDVLRRTIFNWTVLAIAALFAVTAVLQVSPSPPLSALAAALIALVAGYVLFLLGFIGGGDAKLMAAVALFFGLSRLPMFALATVLIGGLIAIGYLILFPKRVMRGLTRRGREEGATIGIPYGVAISLGALVTGLFTQGFFPAPIGWA